MCPRQGASHTTDNVETKSGCIYSTQILSRHCRPSPAHCALSGTLTRLTQVQNFAFTFYTSETILCIDTFSSKLYNIHSYKTQSAPQQTYEGWMAWVSTYLLSLAGPVVNHYTGDGGIAISLLVHWSPSRHMQTCKRYMTMFKMYVHLSAKHTCTSKYC